MTAPTAHEVNFDGLVGPTHNYAGLSWGNLASQRHRNAISNPRQAALQGLAKMKFLADLGLKQAVLPPHHRPDFAALRRLGFTGSDADILWDASTRAPRLLAACYSSSAMWAANAATVSPSADTADRRVHFTPANLLTQFHRSLETDFTAKLLRTIFADSSHFVHHAPLPATELFADEGAANHTRLCASHGNPGIELFVYGRSAEQHDTSVSFPARQTLQASQAIARLHQLAPAATIYLRQNAAAIDAGAFHNDVVAVGNENLLFFHTSAFADPESAKTSLTDSFRSRCNDELHLFQVQPDELSLAQAVETYLFNSQLITLPDNTAALIAPLECRDHPQAQAVLQRLQSTTPIRTIHYLDVRQSMHNGGGPACLRLRVVLTDAELARAHPGVFLTDTLYTQLTDWITRHYRDHLAPDDLADPLLPEECRAALDGLTSLLALGPIYPFQH